MFIFWLHLLAVAWDFVCLSEYVGSLLLGDLWKWLLAICFWGCAEGLCLEKFGVASLMLCSWCCCYSCSGGLEDQALIFGVSFSLFCGKMLNWRYLAMRGSNSNYVVIFRALNILEYFWLAQRWNQLGALLHVAAIFQALWWEFFKNATFALAWDETLEHRLPWAKLWFLKYLGAATTQRRTLRPLFDPRVKFVELVDPIIFKTAWEIIWAPLDAQPAFALLPY